MPVTMFHFSLCTIESLRTEDLEPLSNQMKVLRQELIDLLSISLSIKLVSQVNSIHERCFNN